MYCIHAITEGAVTQHIGSLVRNHDNIQTDQKKGRLGGAYQKRKLTPEQVRAIKHMLVDRIDKTRIAERFKVSWAIIHHIARGDCCRNA